MAPFVFGVTLPIYNNVVFEIFVSISLKFGIFGPPPTGEKTRPGHV